MNCGGTFINAVSLREELVMESKQMGGRKIVSPGGNNSRTKLAGSCWNRIGLP